MAMLFINLNKMPICIGLPELSKKIQCWFFFPNNTDVKYKEVLVIVRPNELKEKWDGHRLRISEAQNISGIETVIYLDSLEAFLQPWIHLPKIFI